MVSNVSVGSASKARASELGKACATLHVNDNTTPTGGSEVGGSTGGSGAKGEAAVGGGAGPPDDLFVLLLFMALGRTDPEHPFHPYLASLPHQDHA